MKFSCLLRVLPGSPVLLSCVMFIPAPVEGLSADCIRVNSAILQDLANGRVAKAQRVALETLSGDPSRLEPVCAGLLLNEAAVASLQSGRLAEARELAEKSITHLQQGVAPGDPVYLRPLNLLASVYLSEGCTRKAVETLRRMETLRVTSPQDRALIREIRAAVLQREHRNEEAEMNYMAALAALSDAGKQDSACAAAVQRSLAYLYLRDRQYSDALKTVDAAIATLRRAKDAVPFDRIQVLHVRAQIFGHEGRWQDAESDLSEALSLGNRELHLDSVILEPLVTDYARALRKLHRKEAHFVENWAATLRSQTVAAQQKIDVVELSGSRGAGPD
jgi:tetratricopeptide (TPR) repeat protein